MLNISQKKEQVKRLAKEFLESEISILVDYKGLDVLKMTDLRAQLRNEGIQMEVVKNTLLERASEGTDAALMKDFYKTFHPQVEHVHENADRESGERVLGTDPKTGRQVSVRLGKFGPMVQIGTVEEEEKPLFASLTPDQQLNSITFEQAMDLFHLPKTLGEYEGESIEVNNGRFGPYVKFGKKFVSLPKGVDPMSLELDDAILLIKEKEKADAPIYTYKELPVQKGKGRFGPFIKWNNMFINVNKKYDWDNLSDTDIVTLIEEKIQKEIDKVIHNWEEEGIRVEKARWGRHHIIKGKTKIELAKTIDVSKFTLEDVKDIIEKNAPKKKTTKRKTTAKK